MAFLGADASPLTKQRHLQRLHKIFNVVTPSNAPPGPVEFQSHPAVTTSTVPPLTPAATLRSVVGTRLTPTAQPTMSVPASELSQTASTSAPSKLAKATSTAAPPAPTPTILVDPIDLTGAGPTSGSAPRPPLDTSAPVAPPERPPEGEGDDEDDSHNCDEVS